MFLPFDSSSTALHAPNFGRVDYLFGIFSRVFIEIMQFLMRGIFAAASSQTLARGASSCQRRLRHLHYGQAAATRNHTTCVILTERPTAVRHPIGLKIELCPPNLRATASSIDRQASSTASACVAAAPIVPQLRRGSIEDQNQVRSPFHTSKPMPM